MIMIWDPRFLQQFHGPGSDFEEKVEIFAHMRAKGEYLEEQKEPWRPLVETEFEVRYFKETGRDFEG